MRKKDVLLRCIIAACGVFFVKNYLFDIRRVSGNSMEPAISDGQFVAVWRLAYGIPLINTNRYLIRWAVPRHNDIVFYAMQDRYVIKRCRAVDSDTLHFRVNEHSTAQKYGFLQLDDRSVPLTVRQFKNLGGFLPKQLQKIPDNFILALGDNPQHSYDSRDYGFVSINSICGKLIWK